MEVRKPDWRDQIIRVIESVPSGIHPTFKREYERRLASLCVSEPLKPFSEWKDSELEAYRFVTPSQWTLYGYAIVLQRCNAFGKWSYRYVLNRVLIQ